MYRFVGNNCYFYAEKENEEYYEPFISSYAEYLQGRKAHNTVKKHITAIHRFWLYSLFFIGDSSSAWLDLSFLDWIDEYDTALKKGFKVNMGCRGSSFRTKGEYFASKPLSDTSQEFAILEAYYKYLKDKDVNPLYELSKNDELVIFSGAKDYKTLDIKAKYSKGSGYGLKIGKLARESLAEKETVFREYKKRKKGSGKKRLTKNKVFPFALYDALLEIADDRSKLIYLLCGAASARFGQALSLTKFDIDMQNKRVYLIDPRTDRVPLDRNGDAVFGQESRSKLLAKYGINFNVTVGKYSKIGFKGPIPIIGTSKQDLYFIKNEYREMFFEVYARYRNKLDDDYPMVFQSRGGSKEKIWATSNASDKFRDDIKKLKKKYPKYEKRLSLKKRYHSLRHMFGQFIANMAYLHSDKFNRDHTTRMHNLENKNTIELFKEFCATKMGHESDAIEIYFNADFAVDSYIQMKIQEKHEQAAKIKQAVIDLRTDDDRLYREVD